MAAGARVRRRRSLSGSPQPLCSDGERGLYSPPVCVWWGPPPQAVWEFSRSFPALEQLQIRFPASLTIASQPTLGGRAFVTGRACLGCQLTQRGRRVPQAKLCESSGERAPAVVEVERADRLHPLDGGLQRQQRARGSPRRHWQAGWHGHGCRRRPACSSSRSTVSPAPVRASRSCRSSREPSSVDDSVTPSLGTTNSCTSSREAASPATNCAASMLPRSRISRCGSRGPESEPPPSKAPRR